MKYFKCPGFNCLRWKSVCNGDWECPGGTDEVQCNRTICPGMYKCHSSAICLSFHNLRVNISDCPFNDDGHFYNLEQDLDIQATCPTNCSCLLFSLFCKQLTLDKQINLKSYFAIYLLEVQFQKDSVNLNKFHDPVFLTIKQSKLSSICGQTKQLNSTANFDISHNNVGILKKDCFAFVYNVKFVNISSFHSKLCI